VTRRGSNRIQFDSEFDGVRYRPTLERAPTEANLRRARKQLDDIKARIADATFSFAEEFPDFRNVDQIDGAVGRRTCNQVFDEFMAHAESRLAKHDLAFATVDGYRKILDAVWRPKLGAEIFERVKYSTLVRIADAGRFKKKTYNNVVSALGCAFDYGYKDHPEKHNPAAGLRCFRLTKKDRPVIGPFIIQEAETLIAAIHRDWGEAQGNFDEFRFFRGLRPSEQIALLVSDCDVAQGKLSVTRARVMARDKDRTKTGEDRLIELCPRALEVLKRQLALRARMTLAGLIKHGKLFFKGNGDPIRNLQYPWVRWKRTLQITLKGRYREPYNARHSSVSWNLMIGKNPLWVAKQHGHSVQTMLDVYAAWTEGTKECDIAAIKRAMESRPLQPPRSAHTTAPVPLASREFGTDLALATHRCSARRGKISECNGGERGIRTRRKRQSDQ
jgi:integrase